MLKPATLDGLNQAKEKKKSEGKQIKAGGQTWMLQKENEKEIPSYLIRGF